MSEIVVRVVRTMFPPPATRATLKTATGAWPSLDLAVELSEEERFKTGGSAVTYWLYDTDKRALVKVVPRPEDWPG